MEFTYQDQSFHDNFKKIGSKDLHQPLICKCSFQKLFNIVNIIKYRYHLYLDYQFRQN